MYEVSVSGYKVTKSTWGEIYATAKPKKIEISVSYERGNYMKYKERVIVQGMKLEALEAKVEGLGLTVENVKRWSETDKISMKRSQDEVRTKLSTLERDLYKIKEMLMLSGIEHETEQKNDE